MSGTAKHYRNSVYHTFSEMEYKVCLQERKCIPGTTWNVAADSNSQLYMLKLEEWQINDNIATQRKLFLTVTIICSVCNSLEFSTPC